MSVIEYLFTSKAQKGHKKGAHKNGPRPYFKKDPEKYMGGKGSKQRRRKQQIALKPTRNEFTDMRANTAEEPVYVKKVAYELDPVSKVARPTSQPVRSIISRSTFLKLISKAEVASLEKTGAKVRIMRGDDNRAYRREVILPGMRRMTVEEFKMNSNDDLYDF